MKTHNNTFTRNIKLAKTFIAIVLLTVSTDAAVAQTSVHSFAYNEPAVKRHVGAREKAFLRVLNSSSLLEADDVSVQNNLVDGHPAEFSAATTFSDEIRLEVTASSDEGFTVVVYAANGRVAGQAKIHSYVGSSWELIPVHGAVAEGPYTLVVKNHAGEKVFHSTLTRTAE